MPAEGSYQARLAELDTALERLVRRLRTLTSIGWRPREAVVRCLAQDLADLAASVEGHEPRRVPSLPTYGLADVVAVLGGDLLASLRDLDRADPLERALQLVAQALEDTV